MGQIKWIQTPKCKDCVKEFNGLDKLRRRLLIIDRKKLDKCKNCPRLKEVLND